MGTEKSFWEHLGEAAIARRLLEKATGEPISRSVSLLTAGFSYYEDKQKAEIQVRREAPTVQYVSTPTPPRSCSTTKSSTYKADAILSQLRQHLNQIPRYVEILREEISGPEALLLPRNIRESMEAILRSADSLRSEVIKNNCFDLESTLKTALEMQDSFREDRHLVRFLSDNSGFIVAQLKVVWGPRGFADLIEFADKSEELCKEVVKEGDALLEETKKFRYELETFRYKIQKAKATCRQRQINERIEALPFPLRWGHKTIKWTSEMLRKLK